MIWLDKRAGTKALVRDLTLLHSAVLLQSICLNHQFTDGNRRTAWGVALWIL